MRILIVDDTELDRLLLTSYIDETIHEVTSVASGQDAINHLNLQTPDLILMDVNMPVLNGFETAKQIRKKFHYENWIPIIFISANTDTKFVQEAIESGGDDFISKPVVKDILLAKINAMERIWLMQKDINEHMRLLDVANEQLIDAVKSLREESQQQKEAEQIVKLQLKRLSVTNKKLSQLRKEERYRALHDPLTNLANRALFQEFTLDEINKCKRHKTCFAMLYLDLDGFKAVNDTLGHSAGDKLLIEIARRLTNSVRKTDMVARLGGDEFGIIITDVNQPEDIATLSRKFLEEINKPVAIDNELAHVSVSIGIAIYEPGTDFDTLSQHADIAMYTAKHNGKSQFQYYNEELHSLASDKLTYREDLTNAYRKNDLNFHYQPVFNKADDTIHSMQCFLRWCHRDEVQLMTINQCSGLLEELDMWILESAFTQLKTWCNHGYDDLMLSINVPSMKLLKSDFVEACSNLARKNKLSADRIIIEIDENELDGALEQMELQLYALSDLGFQLALSNYGTGLTALRFLYELPLSYLKLDAEFIASCSTEARVSTLIGAIVYVAQCLDINLIVGNVNNQEQHDYILEKGVELLQGSYFIEPIEPSQCLDLLNKHNIKNKSKN